MPDKNTSEYRSEIWQSYLEIINSFVNSGKNVYLVLQIPEVKSEIHQLFQLVDNENKYVESVSTDWWKKESITTLKGMKKYLIK